MSSTVIKEMIMKMFIAEMEVRYNIANAEKMLPVVNNVMKKEFESLYGENNDMYVYRDVDLDFIGLSYELVVENKDYVILKNIACKNYGLFMKHSVDGWVRVYNNEKKEKVLELVELVSPKMDNVDRVINFLMM